MPYAEVIGDPIAHSKSPLIHKFWLEKLGLDYDYRCTRVAADGLTSYLESRLSDQDWCGCNLTIPHKLAAAELVDVLIPPAKATRSVNCVVRQGASEPCLVGHNTDVAGFLEPLAPWLNRSFSYRFASVLGTGGAAVSVSYALARAGFLVISYGRSHERTLDFRRKLDLYEDPDFAQEIGSLATSGRFEGGRDPDRLDLLVNATPLGMAGFPSLEINLDWWSPETLVYDLVYNPLETELLRGARERGMARIDGLTMLVGQAAAAFERFFVAEAPREHDSELRELLTR